LGLGVVTERNHIRELIEKLESLSPERMAEVEDFVDFLKSRDQSSRLVRVAARVAEPRLKKVWDNSEDSIYDTL